MYGVMQMTENTALFLDFDGVICDSYVECFAMSWYAYFYLFREEKEVSMKIADKPRYRKLRPMVRNSEDNVVIQHILARELRVESQEDFDVLLKELGAETLGKLRKCFYDTREYFLDRYRNFWLGLNYLFPGMPEILKEILSTKKPAFIDEILKYNGIAWPYSRILEAHGRSKETIILDILDTGGHENAVFIDDQIDHLYSDGGGRISCYLAEWGYVSDEGLRDLTVPHMTLGDCAELASRFAPPRPIPDGSGTET